MLILPTIDSTISQLSKAGLIGLFFGLANVMSGLGEAGGKFIGGQLLEIGTEIAYIPYSIYGVTGIALFFLILLLKRWKPLEISLEKAAQQEDTPKHAPKVPLGPTKHRTHPYNQWIPEAFFRKKGHPQR